MQIVLLGTGNVAVVLGRLIANSEHSITQVYGRNRDNARLLAEELSAISGSPVAFTAETKSLDLSAGLYLVAVSDSALIDIKNWLKLDKQLVAHTAGGVSQNVLKTVSANYGIFYPLQSLRKEMTRIPHIPFLVDGNTPENLATLFDLAKDLSPDTSMADDTARLKLHVGAIIVNNFTNYLFTLAEDYCRQEDIPFNTLKPLIREVAERIDHASPGTLQTGPAIRNDEGTIQKHKEMLRSYPALFHLYDEITRSIQQYYQSRSGQV
ncbi:MAG: DUF2520 domain-containing protein [Chitinophagaceae bacterium]|nr:DUF2520 domain-containing protein [Chitinophagaceae bacterium]